MNKGTRLKNKLALKFQNFSTNIPQTSALVLVQTNKSEHSSLTSSLVFDKACQVSLNTILFIERMNKIEDNRSFLYKTAFSSDRLLVLHNRIKSKPGNLTSGDGEETLKGINLNWFKSVSNKLFKGSFVYPRMRRVLIPKKAGSVDTRPLTITSPRLTSNNKRLSGISAILSAVNRKQIPLCSRHHLEFEVGKYSPLDVNFLKKIYNVDCSGLNFEDIFLGRQS